MNKPILIKPTNNPDYGWDNKEELLNDTLFHIHDVGNVLNQLSNKLSEIGYCHDWSKLTYFDDFSNDCLERLTTPEFKSRPWYHIHTTNERHHLNTSCPDDVNLLDVLEMITDCICAGKSRSGEVNPSFLVLDEGVLEKAYWNTVVLVNNMVEVRK